MFEFVVGITKSTWAMWFSALGPKLCGLKAIVMWSSVDTLTIVAFLGLCLSLGREAEAPQRLGDWLYT